MKQQDYGRIFIPQEYGIEYAKSPQAIIFDDFVRIYFSYCVPDHGKLISKVGFLDYDKSFHKIRRVVTEVIKDAVLGAFDEHGIFPFSPFRDGHTVKAITCGWSRRQSVSVEGGLGLAVSYNDGETFERVGDGPVLTAWLHEPFLIADGFVVKMSESNYKMFYIYGTGWHRYQGFRQPERTYRIAAAESDNLLEWKRNGRQLIPEKFSEEAQALPTVVKWRGLWHMFFCYRHTVDFRDNSRNAYRIGYAYSKDLENWMRDDDKISIPLEEWCGEMQCYPNAFVMEGDLYLLYNGNHFGKNGFGLLKWEKSV